MTTHEEISETVRRVAGAHGELHRDVARALGLSAQGLSNRMNGRANWTIDDLNALAEHWGCHPWDLMQGPAEGVRRTLDQPTG